MTPLARILVGAAVAAFSIRAISHAAAQPRGPAGFSVVEATIADLQRAMADGRATSRAITAQSLERLNQYEARLNAAITVNPTALAEAEERDRERRQRRVRGPLHGIPVALKDNIQTVDMPTTGGALAFERLRPPSDATLTRLLRQAGAIILAKTTLTELANWVASDMPAGYSSLAKFSFNPYDPRSDPRDGSSDGRPVLSAGGSSSGIGTAASFWVANVGTETSGSILNPANQNMLVGIKPTVGRISRHGVIPITADQDTPGPLARSVADAATMLGALEGPAPDPDDPATRACTPPRGRDYTRFLRADALKGARVGIPRAFFYDPIEPRGPRGRGGGLTPPQRQVMADAIGTLAGAGATIVDPADLPSVIANDRTKSLLEWPICVGNANRKGFDTDCSIVFKYGMKRDFNTWLASLGAAAPVKTLTELRAWNRDHASEGSLRFGQDELDISDEIDLVGDRSRYLSDRAKDLDVARRNGIDSALRTHQLDALLFPAYLGAAVAARAGYPTVTVPFGTVPNAPFPPLPRGFDARSSPFGVSFTGTACSEPRLLGIAYAFEQATKRRTAPNLER
jgi:amidase